MTDVQTLDAQPGGLQPLPGNVGYMKVWMDGNVFLALPEQQEQNLGTLEGKFTLGDFTKDSERYLSSLIIGDITGGALADKVRGTTAQRYLRGIIEGTYPNKITLAPIIDEFSSPVALLPGQTFTPIGTHGLTFYAAFGTKFCSFTDSGNGRGNYVAVADLSSQPSNVGQVYKNKLYIPVDDGYFIWDGASLSAKQTSAQVRDFSTFDTQLWALTSDRKVGFTTDGISWTFPAELQFNDEIPRHILEFVNTAKDPALVFNTEQAIWYVDPTTPKLRRTKVHWPAHPDFGKAAMVWPSGQDYYTAQGMGMLRYDGETAQPGVGLDRDAGVPAELRGFIQDAYAAYNEAWLLVQGQSGTDVPVTLYFDEPAYRELSPVFSQRQAIASLWLYNGVGFHQRWQSTNAADAATKLCLNTASGAYRIVWGCGQKAFHMDLRLGAYNPQEGLILGLDRFSETSFFETGRFYADTEGLKKIASHIEESVLYATDTEQIKVYFETDDHPGWNLMGITSADGRFPIRFNVVPEWDNFSAGHISEWFRFRFELVRKSTAGMVDPEKLATERLSPMLDSAVFKFFKLPEPTTTRTLTIMIGTEPFAGQGPDQMTEHLHRLSGNVEFFPVVIGRRVYRGRVTNQLANTHVGNDTRARWQLTILDVPDGRTADEYPGLVEIANEAIENTP